MEIIKNPFWALGGKIRPLILNSPVTFMPGSFCCSSALYLFLKSLHLQTQPGKTVDISSPRIPPISWRREKITSCGKKFCQSLSLITILFSFFYSRMNITFTKIPGFQIVFPNIVDIAQFWKDDSDILSNSNLIPHRQGYPHHQMLPVWNCPQCVLHLRLRTWVRNCYIFLVIAFYGLVKGAFIFCLW